MEDNKQYWGDAMTKNCVWLFQTNCQKECGDGNTVDFWRTCNVFLTRREGMEHGNSRPYEYGEAGKDWRIYGVMCIGLMAEILGRNNKEFEKDVEHITKED